MNILVTGGAGFIGSHLVRKLLAGGERVTVFDNLDPQVHGRPGRPARAPRLRHVVADVRDRTALVREVHRADAVVHFAAAVGVGQSQYQIRHYVDVNLGGTAMLLDLLANTRHHVRKLLVAGSMSSYGEGAYECRRCGRVRPPLREPASVRGGRWEPACPGCRGPLAAVPTRESDPFICSSIYAVTKMGQEELAVNFGVAYDVPVVALRFFNVFGPGQSLSNPYTGAAAIFMSRLKNGKAPVLYEDGLQTRDFVSVHDIVEACSRALRGRLRGVFNVGTGRATSILDLARRLARASGLEIEPKIARRFRRGDIRHCFADFSALRKGLGYRPRVSLDDGLAELVEWSRSASARDRYDRAEGELRRRGLL